jgi:hypothetical protein
MADKENNENPPAQVPDKQAVGAGDTENQHPAKHNPHAVKPTVPESGGRGGLDPTRFGDWEIAGKCVDF